MNITRTILRVGLISGLALGGLTLLIGPHKVAAGLHQIRVKAQSVIDQVADEPAALRRQLQVMADEYPERIAEVRGELAAVNHEIAEFDRDANVAARVVAMTTDDLVELKTLVTKARNLNSTTRQAIYVRFKGVRFDVDQAYSEGNRINDVRVNYQDRLASDQQQLSFLNEQKSRLVEILDRLETENSEFQTKMWQLDSQIDAIERNERLIDMTKELQATLDSYDQWGKIGNLKMLESKLAEMKTIQTAQLEAIRQTNIRWDYAKEAARQLDGNDVTFDPTANYFEELEVEDADEASFEDKDKIAWLEDPRIVE